MKKNTRDSKISKFAKTRGLSIEEAEKLLFEVGVYHLEKQSVNPHFFEVGVYHPKLVQRTTTTVDTNNGTRVEVIEEFERA